jgi:hypothetical protein
MSDRKSEVSHVIECEAPTYAQAANLPRESSKEIDMVNHILYVWLYEQKHHEQKGHVQNSCTSAYTVVMGIPQGATPTVRKPARAGSASFAEFEP